MLRSADSGHRESTLEQRNAVAGKLGLSDNPLFLFPRQDWRRRYRNRALALDIVIAWFVVTGVVATPWLTTEWSGPLTLLGVPVWIVFLLASGAYSPRKLVDTPEEYRSVLRTGFYIASFMAIAHLIAPSLPMTGGTFVGLTILLFLTLVGRKVLRTLQFRRRAEGRNLQRALVVGYWGSVEQLVETIAADPVRTGMSAIAVCTEIPPGAYASGLGDVPVYGVTSEALVAVDELDIDVVAITSHPELSGLALRRLSWALEARGVELVVAPGIVEVAGPRLTLRPTSGISLLHLERPLRNEFAYRTKVLAERLIASLASILLAPLAFVVMAAIKMDSPGPVLFTQKRIGAGGETFSVFKFRTMVVDAEVRKPDIDGGHDVNERLFKLKVDPRVTRVGRVLRRFSLDEFPQLLNVVRGEMSFIGPRPPLPEEVRAYESDAHRRLRVLPGLTGMWQVSGRSDLDWQESLRLDLWYVDNWSLTLDLQILARTVRAVVQGRGAY